MEENALNNEVEGGDERGKKWREVKREETNEVKLERK